MVSPEVTSEEDLVRTFTALCATDPEAWFRAYAVIKGRDGRLINAPQPNVMQRRMFAYYRECQAAGKPCLMLILKPRQRGASTGAAAIMYHHKRRFGMLNGTLMGDREATSDTVFELFRRYAENDVFAWPDGLGVLNAKSKDNGTDEIILPGKSKYGKETAGSRSAGRGGTIQCANMTEVAWFRDATGADPTLGYLNSFNDQSPLSLGIGDSTPNGTRGWFYDQCMSKSSSWKLIFTAWFEFDDDVERPFNSAEEREEFMANLRPDERDELKRFNKDGIITPEKLHWRRFTIADKCQGDVDKFRQEYPSDPYECFLKSSRPRFDLARIESVKKFADALTPVRGSVAINEHSGSASFAPDAEGLTEIWEHPKYGAPYLVSVDSMTGEDQVDGSETSDPDYHSIQVWRGEYIDLQDRHHVARMVARHKSRIDVDLAALEAFGLSQFFGGCLIVPEVNNCGLAIVKKLQSLGANVYRRKVVNATENKVVEQMGWKTDTITRKTIIDHLAARFRDGELDIPSPDVLDQFKTFIVNRNGKPEAMRGRHDDCVMSAAIGVYNLGMATVREKPRRAVDTEDISQAAVGGFISSDRVAEYWRWLRGEE